MTQFWPRRYKQKSMLGVRVWQVPGKIFLKRESQLTYTFVPFPFSCWVYRHKVEGEAAIL